MLLLLSVETDSPFIRVPVGLLHRIMEAKIGNKQKTLDHCVPDPTDYSLDRTSKECVYLFNDEK